jgi:hypothetical protein
LEPCWLLLSPSFLGVVLHKREETIAAELRIKTGDLTIETTTTRGGRSTISVPRIVTISALITKKIFGNGASIQTGVTSFALVNIFLLEFT